MTLFTAKMWYMFGIGFYIDSLTTLKIVIRLFLKAYEYVNDVNL